MINHRLYQRVHGTSIHSLKCGISLWFYFAMVHHDRWVGGFQPLFRSTLAGPNWYIRTYAAQVDYLIWLFSMDGREQAHAWACFILITHAMLPSARSHVTGADCRGDAGAPYASRSVPVGVEIIARLDFPPADTST